MSHLTVQHARDYVETLSLPAPSRMRGAGEPSIVDLAFDRAKDQAAVVGSDLISFVQGVTPERREAIVNSSLLAQLAAKKKVPDPDKTTEWYDAYFDVLTNIGWVIQDKQFAEYDERSENFEAHKAIMMVATTLLGPAAGALAIVESTLKALESMDEGNPWITIFNRESAHAKTARFQVSLAEQHEGDQFFVTLMAFSLEAKTTITQVLLFKTKASAATLRHSSGKVTINTTVLDSVRGPISAKLVGLAQDFVKSLPDL
jgi:hypothetical protein